MPRIRQELRPRPDAALVQQVAAAYALVQGAERQALDHARALGQLLLGIPEDERWRVWYEATGGKSRRTGQDYARVADHWPQIEDAIAQRAARPTIRGALAFLKTTRRPGRDQPLPFEDRCLITKHEKTGWCRDDR